MTMRCRRDRRSSPRERLDDLYRSFDHVTSATDPVHIVRRYQSPADREVVGFCAAALAFGRVASVLQSIESLLAVMGPHPAQFVRRFDPVRDAIAARAARAPMDSGRDLMALLIVLQRMLAKQVRSRRSFFRATTRVRRTSARRSIRFRRAPWPRTCAPPTDVVCRASVACPTSSRGHRPAARASVSTCSCAGWFAATPSISASGRRCLRPA